MLMKVLVGLERADECGSTLRSVVGRISYDMWMRRSCPRRKVECSFRVRRSSIVANVFENVMLPLQMFSQERAAYASACQGMLERCKCTTLGVVLWRSQRRYEEGVSDCESYCVATQVPLPRRADEWTDPETQSNWTSR